ncbi:hypothetical protein P3719_18395 [Vibrio parahaemolyticus]|uniref:Uncharacterized protein n=1 Tax=Vibrio diabolicus TaxID=50719 RepID=A0AA92LXK9_9VIBR|nr:MULTISPECIES: hypothetical protein [Vibrio]EJG1066116.1 hypothetical protein [Vibrio parahaemolyticus O1]MDW1807438.1 hypothetical protein [Vibrio sp. Vb2362]MDW2296403.1 hypothetical protein [Vibrio sp. 1404]ALR95563.1 hypothetical protein AT730_25260 [Vibrio alginolyticus]APX09806.1 hypothetical protein BWP24_26705 [Vibrio campbellii]
MEGLGIIVFNGIGMLLCFSIGSFVAYFGYKIFKRGASLKEEEQLIEWNNLKVSSKGGGAIVTSCSAIWAIVGLYVSPGISNTPNGPDYTSIHNKQNIELKVASAYVDDPESILDNPEELKKYFSESLSSRDYDVGIIHVNGRIGRLDSDSTNYLVDSSGNTTLTAEAEGEFGKVLVLFRPKVNEKNQLIFDADALVKNVDINRLDKVKSSD